MPEINSASAFDVAIIGSGPGGYVAAIRGAQIGLRVAIIEKDPKYGGTCLHRGCIPTKALLHDAYLYDQIKHAADVGITCKDVSVDFEKVQNHKNRIVKKLAVGVEFLLKKNKVTMIQGYGRIKKPGVIEIVRDGKPAEEVRTKNIIVATGSEPRSLPGIELDGKDTITNNEALEFKAIPKSMAIIGAGAVGVEFASIYARFGCQVTLVELLPQILPLEDTEIATELQKILAKRGIAMMTESQVQSVKSSKKGVDVSVKAKDGSVKTVSCEKVLVAVGRRPNTDKVGLENTRVKVNRGFIEVNEYMETAEPGIYAIGDVVPTPQLAHVASAEGIVAMERIKGLPAHPVNYALCPNCTYCDPQVASVGLTEKKAKEKGHDIRIGRFPFQASGKASILGESEGLVKIIEDKKYGEILGVHVLHAQATEMIAEACAAMSSEMTVEDLARTMHAHPTLSEAIAEAAHNVYGLAVHF